MYDERACVGAYVFLCMLHAHNYMFAHMYVGGHVC